MTEIFLTLECHRCETVVKNRILNLSDNEFSLTSFGQSTFVCPNCGLEHYIGDIEVYTDGQEEDSQDQD